MTNSLAIMLGFHGTVVNSARTQLRFEGMAAKARHHIMRRHSLQITEGEDIGGMESWQ